MDLCTQCALAQLADGHTVAAEPQCIDPREIRHQAMDAVQRVGREGWLDGATVYEFSNPHGGTWLPLLAKQGFAKSEPADVVLDPFSIMHDPCQRLAFEMRATTTAPDGVLLLQFHSLLTMVSRGQWNALRPGHFAYYSLTALTRLLDSVGMSVATAWEFDIYGGSVLVGGVHGRVRPDRRVREILTRERDFGITDAAVVGRLQQALERQVAWLRHWLEVQAASGRAVYGYGAGSDVAALFRLAGVDRRLVPAVADASRALQGRRLSGTDVAIVSPERLIAANPDLVLLNRPYLYEHLRRRHPQLRGRWATYREP